MKATPEGEITVEEIPGEAPTQSHLNQDLTSEYTLVENKVLYLVGENTLLYLCQYRNKWGASCCTFLHKPITRVKIQQGDKRVLNRINTKNQKRAAKREEKYQRPSDFLPPPLETSLDTPVLHCHIRVNNVQMTRRPTILRLNRG